MKNLSEMDLVELNQSEMVQSNGGVLMIGLIFGDLIEGGSWAYTQLKKGIYDGYNNQ